MDIDCDLSKQFQAIDTRFFSAIHHGDIDVVNLALGVLINRGLKVEDRRLVFAKAGELLGF
jgi:hypothetical protein